MVFKVYNAPGTNSPKIITHVVFINLDDLVRRFQSVVFESLLQCFSRPEEAGNAAK
jgi:hypothetical protein